MQEGAPSCLSPPRKCSHSAPVPDGAGPALSHFHVLASAVPDAVRCRRASARPRPSCETQKGGEPSEKAGIQEKQENKYINIERWLIWTFFHNGSLLGIHCVEPYLIQLGEKTIAYFFFCNGQCKHSCISSRAVMWFRCLLLLRIPQNLSSQSRPFPTKIDGG
jgi:hypothetical protein